MRGCAGRGAEGARESTWEVGWLLRNGAVKKKEDVVWIGGVSYFEGGRGEVRWGVGVGGRASRCPGVDRMLWDGGYRRGEGCIDISTQ